jgi:ketopantoate reductase
MRIAILGTQPIGTALGGPLAHAGHDVVLAPGDAAGQMPVDVVVVAVEGPLAGATIANAGALRGQDSFVVALVSGWSGSPGAGPPRLASARVTVGELNHRASARAVRVAQALQEAGVNAEVSIDIHAALARLGGAQDGSAGGESDAWRRC